MKFTVKSSELVKKLKSAIKAYDSKEDRSYISFAIEQTDGVAELVIVGRSNSAYAEAIVEVEDLQAEADEPKVFYVEGNVLRKLTTVLPSAPINLTFEITEASRSFKIKYVGSELKLPVLSDNKSMKAPVTAPIATVLASDLMPILRDLSKVLNTDPSAAENQTSCLDFRFEDEKLTVMGTDSYALATVTVPFTPEKEGQAPIQVLIRHTEINTLIDSFSPNEQLTIELGDGKFGYTDENDTLTLVSHTNLKPIAYGPLLNRAESSNHITMSKDEFKAAIDTIATLSFHSNTVSLTAAMDSNVLVVSGPSGDKVEVAIEDLNLEKDLTVSFSIPVLLEALIPLAGKQVSLKWGFQAVGPTATKPPIVRLFALNSDGSEVEEIVVVAVPLND